MSGKYEPQNDAVRQQAQADRDTYAAGRDITIYQGQIPPTAERPRHPEADTWIAAIHSTPDDYEPVGCGVILDDLRVLTCAHILQGLAETWVAFPKADGDASEARRKVASILFPDAPGPVKDLVILVLAEPIPTGVTPAPLRCPKSVDLVNKRWWAFGFPSGDPLGGSAYGQVGTSLGYGWVQLDIGSRNPVVRGFSGSGLWSPEYQAVIAVIGLADDARGDGRAVTLHQVDKWFPDQKIRIQAERYVVTDAGDVALSAWGWSLSNDAEGTRHWYPRARGVSIDSEVGYRFRGRTAALSVITAWLDREVPDRRVLVVTGAPGAGKSAVLGRIVTTADIDAVRYLPTEDPAVRATLGSVGCAVHAKGLTALEIATKIATAASASLPAVVDDFAPAVRGALSERAAARFNVIIDALDEAASPTDTRLVISKVIMPMVETCADIGAQVIVGTRRSDTDGDLVTSFAGAATLVDLDTQEFFEEGDLASYALATLQLEGAERTGNPYSTDMIAVPVAERIARLSDGNFLVAGLTARTHGMYDEKAVDPGLMSFSPKVDDAMREYLKRIPPVKGFSAEILLTALAYAESPGLPINLWLIALTALGYDGITEIELLRFARSLAASFVVESSAADGATADFRLFHQSLNDALLHFRATLVDARKDELALTRVFMTLGKEVGWGQAHIYLRRSLPSHAVRAEVIDDLLADDDYLLHADLLRLQPLVDRASSEAGRQRARLLRLSPRDVIGADASNRAAIFSVTEAVEGIPAAYKHSAIKTQYRAEWAVTPPSREHSILRGHDGQVNAVCSFPLGDATLLATAGADRSVRTWDPATGTIKYTLNGHDARVNEVCTFSLSKSVLLASAASPRSIRIWDPTSGITYRILTGKDGEVSAICGFSLDGYPLLASGDEDGTVRIWDPESGTERLALIGHDGKVNAICAFALNGTTLLASASTDQTVRIWDPSSGSTYQVLTGHNGGVNTVCAFTLKGATFLASAGADEILRVWNLTTGEQREIRYFHHAEINSVCTFTLDGTDYFATISGGIVRILTIAGILRTAFTKSEHRICAICAFTLDSGTRLATGGYDGAVRIWDPSTLPLGDHSSTEHNHPVRVLCALAVNGTTHLAATGSYDPRVRVFAAPTAGIEHSMFGQHARRVSAACAFTLGDGTYLATVSIDDTIQVWNPASKEVHRTFTGLARSVNAVCAFTLDGTTFLAMASSDGTIAILDPDTGTAYCILTGHEDRVTALCAFTIEDATFLASASDDGTVRIWDPGTGTTKRIMVTHKWVNAVRAFTFETATFIVTASIDHTVRIWDPVTGISKRTLTGHEAAVNDACAFAIHGTAFVATASDDRTVRIWNPAKESSVLTIPTRDEALSLAYADGLLFAGTTTGLLAIRLNIDLHSFS